MKSVKENILSLITEAHPARMKTNQISKLLKIKSTDEDYELVRLAISELIDENKIVKGAHRSFGLVVTDLVIEGKFDANTNGGGTVVSQDREHIFEIDKYSTWNAIDGDIVRARLLKNRNSLQKGEITRVVSRANTLFSGSIFQGKKGQLYLKPDNKKICFDFLIRRKNINNARINDKVEAKLLDWHDPEQLPEVSVTRVIGKAGEVKAELQSVLSSFKLDKNFNANVNSEVEKFGENILQEEIDKRKDLRGLQVFTIDPDDAKDFDDAISIETISENEFQVGIHIADVSYFVKENSALDKEAQARGTSVYLVGEVVPMLPEKLSNDLCSLKPNCDRLTYSVIVRLSGECKILDYEICKSIIHSKRRFTYNEVLNILETNSGDMLQELTLANRIATALREKRRLDGSTDFDTSESKFTLDENGFPTKLEQKKANKATKLIEDFMLLANKIVAQHIAKRKQGSGMHSKARKEKLPFVYRIHDSPPPEKVREFANYLKTFGINFPKENIKPMDYKKLIDQVRGTANEDPINDMAVRSMAKAVYSSFNIGHFGLAFQDYTHFTSPIRRYPDLIVHRLLSEYSNGVSNQKLKYYKDTLEQLCDHASMQERNAVLAERESIKIAETYFMKNKVGSVYSAVITGIMPFGVFAKIDEYGIEGKIRIKEIRDDYYTYNEQRKELRGRRNGKVFRLRDKVTVRVLRVDEFENYIDLEIV